VVWSLFSLSPSQIIRMMSQKGINRSIVATDEALKKGDEIKQVALPST
jgi:predicted transcriptional regulator